MKKSFALILAFLTGLTACTGTPVVYGGDCPQPTQTDLPANAVRTGLSLLGSFEPHDDSPTCRAQLVAVTVDHSGIILSCAIDAMSARLSPDVQSADVLPDSETGSDQQDWQALADRIRGRTLSQLSQADPALPEAVLAAIETAVSGAGYLGAVRGDELRLASIGTTSLTPAAQDQQTAAALSCDAVALTLRDGIITSCIFDGLQAQLAFDSHGRPTSDLSRPVHSKNALGDAYGMKTYGGAQLEWRDQAAAFAACLRGKSVQQLADVAVIDGHAASPDIASTVTISVGGFLRLAERALAA